MMLTMWTTAALVLWLVLWSLGAGAFDAFMIPVLIIIIAATAQTLRRHMPNRRA
jgi:hypothetical protein